MVDVSSNTFGNSLIETTRPVKRRKILLLGSPGAGKSALIMRFKENIFLEHYEPTLQNSCKKFVAFHNDYVELEIIDLDGQTEYTIFSPNKFSFGINGYLLVYSVDNAGSFGLLESIDAKLSALVGKKVPKIWIGNQSDKAVERQVSTLEGQRFARGIGCPFIECSAKENINVKTAFYSLIVEINRIESNFDVNLISCSCFYKCWIKHEVPMKWLLFFLMFINIINGILCITLGMWMGFKLSETFLIYPPLIYGLWTTIYSIIGMYGWSTKKVEMINFYSIGWIVSEVWLGVSFVLKVLNTSLVNSENEGEGYVEMFYTVLLFVFVGFNGIVAVLSFSFKTVYELDLGNFII